MFVVAEGAGIAMDPKGVEIAILEASVLRSSVMVVVAGRISYGRETRFERRKFSFLFLIEKAFIP